MPSTLQGEIYGYAKLRRNQPLGARNQFCFAFVFNFVWHLTKSYKPLLDKIGLTYPQYLVMLTLWQQDHLLVKEIGELLFSTLAP